MGLWGLRARLEGRLRLTARLLVMVRAFNGRFHDEEVTGFKLERARDRAAPLRSIVSTGARLSSQGTAGNAN